LYPTVEQKLAGFLTEPPVSEPNDATHSKALTETALPPEDPPGTYSVFHGFLLGPNAVNSIGVSKSQLIRYVVIPESASHLLSQLLYMFDYNIRQTSILGLVGAGGIGFYIINYIKFFEYGKAAVFMLVVLVTVLIIDWISVKIRDKYIIKSQHGMEVTTK